MRDFPLLNSVLDHRPSLARFRRHDVLAKRLKLSYNVVGISAVVLSLAALLGEVLSLGRYLSGQGTERWVLVVAATAGVVALVLVALAWVARLRHRWLENVFIRERIRQWRFQQCLNFELLALPPGAQERSLKVAWDELLQRTTIADGAMRVFLHDAEGTSDLMVDAPQREPTTALASEVVGALEALRLDHQEAFATSRLAHEDFGSLLGVANRLTENVAVWAFASAVVVTIFGLVSTATDPANHSGLTSAVALSLLAVSAAVRTLRSGLGLPDLIESFEQYASTCCSLQIRYHETKELQTRIGLLTELERASAGELRRYLNIVSRSRYLL